MTQPPRTVVLDNEAVEALADVHHPKHRAVLAVLEVTNQRRSRSERLRVVVPVAVRVEAGWDRTDPAAAYVNRISRAVDVGLAPAGANRCVRLRRLVTQASVVDVTVAQAAEAAALQPATIVTSDAGDITRLAGHLDGPVVVAVI
jgi:hypothetical protein